MHPEISKMNVSYMTELYTNQRSNQTLESMICLQLVAGEVSNGFRGE